MFFTIVGIVATVVGGFYGWVRFAAFCDGRKW